MSSVGLDSVTAASLSRKIDRLTVTSDRSGLFVGARGIVIALAAMISFGFALRLIGLGAIGFAEDESNKVEAVRAYDHGDFTANAEHPMLMKLLMDLSMRSARGWNKLAGARRTYFENQHKMRDVRARFTLVYDGCLGGHTAAEVYAAPPNASAAVSPCGDLRPGS